MQYEYKTSGTCSKKINFDIEKNSEGQAIVKNVKFTSGCSGNTQGVASLVEGMSADEILKRLSGIKCGMKSTSCPDQLARAVKEACEKL